MEYFSDASYDSDHSDEEDDIIPLYTERELDYMELETLLDSRNPPPVIEYAKDIGVVSLRGAVLVLKRFRIGDVVDRMTEHSWNNFWSNNRIDEKALFSIEDWNAIGEFSFTLCLACGFDNPTVAHVQNVMLVLLSYGNFKHPK